MWKRKVKDKWYLCWYGKSESPDKCSNHQREIVTEWLDEQLIPVNQDENIDAIKRELQDLFYSISTPISNKHLPLELCEKLADEVIEIVYPKQQLKSSPSPTQVRQKIDEDEFADWEQVNCGIGAAIAVFNECKITVPEDHPDPTAINDCINMTRDAQIIFNKLKKKYLEATPVQEELREDEYWKAEYKKRAFRRVIVI